MTKSEMFRALMTTTIMVTLSAGCAYDHKYPYAYKVKNLGKYVAITTDASKRSLLLNTAQDRSCSEPAPDAIGTIATSLAAKLSAQAEQPQSGTEVSADGSVDTTTQTAITQLFQRSQGVQVLRDGMYRLCEAHLNDALDSATYRLSVLSLISTLNYVVPIELCTRLASNGTANGATNEAFKNCVAASYNFASALNKQTADSISEIMKTEQIKAGLFQEFLKKHPQGKESAALPR